MVFEYQSSRQLYRDSTRRPDFQSGYLHHSGHRRWLDFLVRRVLGITAWSGPADSIYAVQQSRESLDVRVGMGSTIAAFVAASGGGSVGQYGPLVHFGATHDGSAAKVHPHQN